MNQQQTQTDFDSREIFRPIVPVYDLMNRVLSGGMDTIWRRTAASYTTGHRILDLACGTGDLAIEIARQKCSSEVLGADILPEMIQKAAGKTKGDIANRVNYLVSNGEKVPFGDETFDSVTIAFGIRNFNDRKRGLEEIYRVLRPGGRAVILEFSMPKNKIVNSAYLFYFTKVLPAVGKRFSGNSRSYSYLPESVLKWPSPEDFSEEIKDIGFSRVSNVSLTLGIAWLHVAQK